MKDGSMPPQVGTGAEKGNDGSGRAVVSVLGKASWLLSGVGGV